MFLKGTRIMEPKGDAMRLLLGTTGDATKKGIPDQEQFRNRPIDDLCFASCTLTAQTASHQNNRHTQSGFPA